MRIVFFSDRYPPDVVGGAEISLYHLVNELKKRGGFDLRVVALTEQQDGATEEIVDGVKVTRVPSRYDHRFPMPNVPVVMPWATNKVKKSLPARIEQRIVRWLDEHTGAPIKKIVGAFKAHVRYLFAKTRSPFWMKIRLLVTNVVCSLRSRENIECLDEDFDRIVDVRALKRTIEELEPDVVHADNLRSILRYGEMELPYAAVALVRDLKFVCPRRVMIGHVGDTPCTECGYACLKEVPAGARGSLKTVFDRNLAYRHDRLNAYDRVVTTSSFLHGFMKDMRGIDAQVVPNPVGDLAPMQRAKETIRRDSPFPTVLSVGMLQRHKGVDHVIRVMPEVRRRYPDARLVIAGRGGYEPVLREVVEEAGIADATEFVGFLTGDDLYRAYVNADVVVCYTRWPEPFGRVPLEAMFFERPVIASALGGFLETVADRETGILVPPADEAALCDAVLGLLSDDEGRQVMGRAGHARVMERFSPEAVAARMAAIYEAVAAKRSAA